MPEAQNPGLLVYSQELSRDITPKPEVDIVAIHEINSERIAPSTHGDFSTMWLKDVLPTRIPSARIMTFGYPPGMDSPEVITIDRIRKIAHELLKEFTERREPVQPKQTIGQIIRRRTTLSLEQRKRRPIIFIGHNLGSAIVKQALLIANNENLYLSIAADTSLLVFFGTPHRAPEYSDWGDPTTSIIPVSLHKPKAFPRTLNVSSKALMDLSLEFSSFTGGISILNFYEVVDATPLSHSTAKIVEKYSTTLGDPTEEYIPICAAGGGCGDCSSFWTDIICKRVEQIIRTDVPKFDEEEISCLKTFSALNPEIYLPRVPEPDSMTSNWIFSNDEYQSWLKLMTPTILFLHGKPGSGKSVISSIVLKNIRASSFGKKRAIIFFSCGQQDERRNSTGNLLSSLVRQLLVQQPSLFRHVLKSYMLVKDRSHWASQELQVLFEGMLYSRSQVEITCIIDGLDKCDPSYTELLEDLVNITTITEAAESPLRFMITTQRLEISKPSKSCFFIDIDTQKAVQDNIKSLVTTGIADIIQKRPGFSGFKGKITEKLFNSPDTTLLTASLALSELAIVKIHSTPFSIGEWLQPLSFRLSEAYKRRLQEILPNWRPWAHEVLSWVLYTVRPLTVDELAIVLAIKSDSESLSAIENDVSRDMISDLKQVFGSLISVENGEIHLIHPTAKEFLISQNEGNSWYNFDPEEAHRHISLTCLTYLSMKEFEDAPPFTGLDEGAPLPQRKCFLTYAAQHWPTHYLRAGNKEPGVHLNVLDFLNRQMKVDLWPKLYWLIVRSRATPSWKSAEDIASELGFTEVFMRLLGSTANNVDKTRALESAARNGHTHLVERLLETNTGTEIMTHNNVAFSEAAQNGHGLIVKLFLESGYNVALANDSDIGPLALAAQNGHITVVQMLLGSSPDLIPTSIKSTALYLAVENGHKSVVKALLRAKIDVEVIPAKYKYPPLHLAAQRGHVAVLKQLLDYGANPEPSDFELTPLHLAAMNGNTNIVKQLLNAKSRVDPTDNTAYTPLHHAASKGHEPVAKLLLAYGADFTKTEHKNNTSLHLATCGGHVAAVKLLLENGADTDDMNDQRNTPLHLAALGGYAAIVKLLLDFGAYTEETNNNYNTPLHLATKAGHMAVVELLLEAGANLQAINETGETPLHLAVKDGGAEIVRNLLDHGADPSVGRLDGWTPLHVGACEPKLEEVRLLLEAGADIGAQNLKGSTPLFLAAELGNETIIEFLLSKGADPQPTNINKSTPLHRASRKGHLRVVMLLLRAGANPKAKKDHGATPLDLAQSEKHTPVVEAMMDNLEVGVLEGMDGRDRKGRTKLFYACSKGAVKDISTLLEAGADYKIKDNDGREPLDLAIGLAARVLLLRKIEERHIEEHEIKTLDGAPPCQRLVFDSGAPLNCDHCKDPIHETSGVFYYHCCRCLDDNYDICQKCYSDGTRCFDTKHNMRLRLLVDGMESFAEYSPWVSKLRWPLTSSVYEIETGGSVDEFSRDSESETESEVSGE